jgi:hypothetical protein
MFFCFENALFAGEMPILAQNLSKKILQNVAG